MIIITRHDITINRFEERKKNIKQTNEYGYTQQQQTTTIKLKNKVIELKMFTIFYFIHP